MTLVAQRLKTSQATNGCGVIGTSEQDGKRVCGGVIWLRILGKIGLMVFNMAMKPFSSFKSLQLLPRF